jgi:hypothetical protein
VSLSNTMKATTNRTTPMMAKRTAATAFWTIEE